MTDWGQPATNHSSLLCFLSQANGVETTKPNGSTGAGTAEGRVLAQSAGEWHPYTDADLSFKKKTKLEAKPAWTVKFHLDFILFFVLLVSIESWGNSIFYLKHFKPKKNVNKTFSNISTKVIHI